MTNYTIKYKPSHYVYNGWYENDFVDVLEEVLDMIMKGESYIKPFTTKEELTKWIIDNQPYYKKPIPGVINYFCDKYNIN